jgi:hypothetical protein
LTLGLLTLALTGDARRFEFRRSPFENLWLATFEFRLRRDLPERTPVSDDD